MPEISVIMPVYNCKTYLPAALSSVLSQEGPSIELIAVDDCSRDGSAEILAEAAAKDPRVRVIRMKENRGVAYARNAALAEAHGTFLAFCDGDDTVPPGAYQAMYQAATEPVKSKDKQSTAFPDIVVGAFRDLLNDGSGAPESRHSTAVPCEKRDSAFLSLLAVPCLWTKLIRRTFVLNNGLTFDEDMHLGEDVVFLARLAAAHPRHRVIENDVYFHWYHACDTQTSLTHTYTLSIFSRHLECRKRLLAIAGGLPECNGYVFREFSWELFSLLDKTEPLQDRKKGFLLLRDFLRDGNYSALSADFLVVAGVTPEEFFRISPEQYFQRRRDRLPREIVAAEFDAGRIGMRWIFRYLRGWLRFKLHLR